VAELYLNGRFLPAEQACIPVLDRGFLFGDSVYEVIPVYGGRPFRPVQHLARLDASLAAIGMANPLPHREWNSILQRLSNQLPGQNQQLYLQITRGVGSHRSHVPPPGLQPTVLAMAMPLPLPDTAQLEAGINAITTPDQRWARCDIKATTLLANILAQRQAAAAGASEAILVRDGLALEGTASNIFVVQNGCLVTPPKGPHLLPGITRDLVLELAATAGIPCNERNIPAGELADAEELWITSSTREIMAVTRLDGRIIGDGHPGPLWRRLLALFRDYKAAFARGEPGND